MYIILASKDNQYRSEVVDGLRAVEKYDYYFYDQKRAEFVIAEVISPTTRVKIVSAGEPEDVNYVPVKIFESFEDIDEARSELESLISFGHLKTELRRVEQ